MTGLGDALMDSVPIVAITGQVSSAFIGTDAFQEADVLGLSLACTKHSFIVQNIEELPFIMAQAFQIAQSGRPGPVLVDIPKDVQFSPTTSRPVVYDKLPITAQNSTALQQASKLLVQAKRPVLYVGAASVWLGALKQSDPFLNTAIFLPFPPSKA